MLRLTNRKFIFFVKYNFIRFFGIFDFKRFQNNFFKFLPGRAKTIFFWVGVHNLGSKSQIAIFGWFLNPDMPQGGVCRVM